MRAIYTPIHTSWAIAIALLLPVCFLSGCLCSTRGVNRGDINIISLEQEWRIGEQLEQELARELPLIEDPAARAYLQQLGDRIVAQTELDDQPWTFHLVADPSVNAFAVPGGHIYVHTG